jgi:hypothetical protein
MSGKIITEGDRLLKADIAHNNFRVDGNGIKIGIISNSFNAKDLLTSDIANGELPGANNPEGRFQPIQVLKDLKLDNVLANEEGRAFAQIIVDKTSKSLRLSILTQPLNYQIANLSRVYAQS